MLFFENLWMWLQSVLQALELIFSSIVAAAGVLRIASTLFRRLFPPKKTNPPPDEKTVPPLPIKKQLPNAEIGKQERPKQPELKEPKEMEIIIHDD